MKQRATNTVERPGKKHSEPVRFEKMAIAQKSNLGQWDLPEAPQVDRMAVKQGRVNALGRTKDFRCIILALCGQTYDVISRATGYSYGKIAYRLRMYGVTPKDFRNGSVAAMEMINGMSERLAEETIENLHHQKRVT